MIDTTDWLAEAMPVGVSIALATVCAGAREARSACAQPRRQRPEMAARER